MLVFLPSAQITSMRQGVLKKKALEAVTYFKIPFACGASKAGALWKCSSAVSSQNCMGSLSKHKPHTQHSRSKQAKRSYTQSCQWQSLTHVIVTCWWKTYFYLFLKVTSQNKLMNRQIMLLKDECLNQGTTIQPSLPNSATQSEEKLMQLTLLVC